MMSSRAQSSRQARDRSAGITLLELVLVIALLIVLCGIGSSLYLRGKGDADLATLKQNMSEGAKILQFGIDNGTVTAGTTQVPADVPNIGAFSSAAQMVVKVTPGDLPGQGINFCIRGTLGGETLYWEFYGARFVKTPQNPDKCPTAADM